MTIQPYKGQIPTIDTDQMREVDRLMMEEYHIELIQMMENAGRCLAIVARDRFLDSDAENKKIIILAGSGGNGGGALVCARRLHNWGANVEVFLTNIDHMTPVPAHQLKILKRIGIPVYSGMKLPENRNFDLIIDGIIGYSIKGNPRGVHKVMIEWANQNNAPTLSLDTPSGLDLTTGFLHNPTIRAAATLTLALPKKGLFEEEVSVVRGDLYLGDISVPSTLYAEDSLNIRVENIFAKSDVLLIE